MNDIQVDRVPRGRDRSMFFWSLGRDYNHRAAERAIHL
jgi:hypothetical protein